MKIKQAIVDGTTVYLFTEDLEGDVLELKRQYENMDNVSPDFPLGYDVPKLFDYTFLGEKHKCITLWFDNEDVPDFFSKL